MPTNMRKYDLGTLKWLEETATARLKPGTLRMLAIKELVGLAKETILPIVSASGRERQLRADLRELEVLLAARDRLIEIPEELLDEEQSPEQEEADQ